MNAVSIRYILALYILSFTFIFRLNDKSYAVCTKLSVLTLPDPQNDPGDYWIEQ
jgi:hypothetical protein